MSAKRTIPAVAAAVLVFSWAFVTGADETKTKGKKSLGSAQTNHEEIKWLRYDEGLKKAKKEGKHVFIDFTAAWCGWCRKMDRETFSRPEVIEMLNNHFIPVKVDGDSKRELNIDGYKITEKNLARHEFRVTGFPSFWFLKPDGTKLAVIRGYRQADFMMEAFDYVKERKYDSTATESSQQEGESKK